ncbi:hypothetical protein [Halalkalibacter hemicellulosilyticus]|uniref:Uncharacterized protein n=1 Tax=Halalkalibacter hemicellulosilyticusJCM 9152 TaxID=1236971 RepID=W4QJI3_9BACI|nr:hypothetical protein [Halalkalibacter hemicellulosilyticus]GAE32072.1 hypothetical protein JCM9152_3588 [Halalkalibacter hemicellulosilyticusJCM 9152]
MKRLLMTIIFLIGMTIVGCSSEDTNTDEEGADASMEEENRDGVEEDDNFTDDEETSANEKEELDVADDEDSAAIATEGLQLQVNKVDQEAGVTIENHPLYADINELVTADPELGIPNDFSVVPLDIYITEEGSSLFFLAVNRLDIPIKNASFDFTLGNTDGELVFDQIDIYLSEEEFGVIEPNHTLPFFLDLTPEGEELYESLTMDNVFMDIENFSMDVEE